MAMTEGEIASVVREVRTCRPTVLYKPLSQQLGVNSLCDCRSVDPEHIIS